MTTINKNRFQDAAPFGGVPFGNLSIAAFNLATKPNGAVIDSDSTTPPAVGDVIVLGVLSADSVLHDSQVVVSDAFTANMTGTLGFLYADGVDSAKVPQDASYFGTFNMGATGRTRNSTTKAPVRLAKDALLVLTVGGAASASDGALSVSITAELLGG